MPRATPALAALLAVLPPRRAAVIAILIAIAITRRLVASHLTEFLTLLFEV